MTLQNQTTANISYGYNQIVKKKTKNLQKIKIFINTLIQISFIFYISMKWVKNKNFFFKQYIIIFKKWLLYLHIKVKDFRTQSLLLALRVGLLYRQFLQCCLRLSRVFFWKLAPMIKFLQLSLFCSTIMEIFNIKQFQLFLFVERGRLMVCAVVVSQVFLLCQRQLL